MQVTYLPMHRNLKYVATCSTLCFGLLYARVRSFVFIVVGVPTLICLFKYIKIYLLGHNELVFWFHITRQCVEPHCHFENKKMCYNIVYMIYVIFWMSTPQNMNCMDYETFEEGWAGYLPLFTSWFVLFMLCLTNKRLYLTTVSLNQSHWLVLIQLLKFDYLILP